jgi:hypothetical protein
VAGEKVRVVMRAGIAAILGLLTAACEDVRFTTDLATDEPADPAITAVRVNLKGLDLRRSDGATRALEFRDGEVVDLLDFVAGDPLRLFTDEELPVGSYTGVRLRFDADEDPNEVAEGTVETPLRLQPGDFATVDFTVEEEGDQREAFTLLLDLRQSLAFVDSDGEYTLTPALRAVRTDDAASIEGDVAQICPVGTLLPQGGALYLFTGRDVEPDDLDGLDAEPVATTRVFATTTIGFRYALRFLAAGDYTLAFTCFGDEDVPGESDDLAFLRVRNVQLDRDQALEIDVL